MSCIRQQVSIKRRVSSIPGEKNIDNYQQRALVILAANWKSPWIHQELEWWEALVWNFVWVDFINESAHSTLFSSRIPSIVSAVFPWLKMTLCLNEALSFRALLRRSKAASDLYASVIIEIYMQCYSCTINHSLHHFRYFKNKTKTLSCVQLWRFLSTLLFILEALPQNAKYQKDL